MRILKQSEQFTIFVQLSDEDTSQYPKAILIDSSGVIVATKDLTPISGVNGKYSVIHTFHNLGDYSAKFAVYSDSGHTILNNKYQLGDELYRVTALESNIETILNRDFKPPVVDFD